MVRQARLQLATSCLENRHSKQLSYWRINEMVEVGNFEIPRVGLKGRCSASELHLR